MLASGTGTVLEALIEAGLPVSVILVDRPCRAGLVAKEAGIALEEVTRDCYGRDFSRSRYTEAVVSRLQAHGIGTVAMAGFGTVLGDAMLAAFPGRVVNTHPSLLPSFKGWHAVKDALEAGVQETGCTVHIATAQVDEGPILARESVPVLPGDTVESLHERIKSVERRLYPAVLGRLISGGEAAVLTGRPQP